MGFGKGGGGCIGWALVRGRIWAMGGGGRVVWCRESCRDCCEKWQEIRNPVINTRGVVVRPMHFASSVGIVSQTPLPFPLTAARITTARYASSLQTPLHFTLIQRHPQCKVPYAGPLPHFIPHPPFNSIDPRLSKMLRRHQIISQPHNRRLGLPSFEPLARYHDRR